MPKILFIAAHRLNRSPSQRYRFEQYFKFLNSHGYECELSYIIDEKSDSVLYSAGNIVKKIQITLASIKTRFKDVSRANDFDIIFIQREAFMTGAVYFEKKFSQSSAKVVFDFDDSIWLLDTSEGNKKWQWLKSAKKTSRIISYADLIFAGNAYLANYAKTFNNNVAIIPTTIDTTVFCREAPYVPKEKICIGWSGSHTTIKHFEAGISFLKLLKQKYGDRIYFKVMGDADYVNNDLDIKGIAWSSATEVAIISSFDIGIMPLPNNEWVKGKCGLKGLSYMALEIPTVMSAVGVNTEIIIDGENGFLANTEAEWVNKLSQLIDSFELRKKLGFNGRKTVEEKYSVAAQKKNYLLCLNSLLNR